MKLKIKTFKGMHCETTATGVLLNQIGIELTEPMLFGLGEGLDFICADVLIPDALSRGLLIFLSVL